MIVVLAARLFTVWRTPSYRPAIRNVPTAWDNGFVLQFSGGKLVGRTTEFGRLTRLLDLAAAGEPVVALVSGDAGMGKTRLVAEVAAAAARQGFMVLSGRCAELGDSVPYLPLADALRSACRNA